MKRWKCPDCEYGAWVKYQCVNHMIMEHRYKSIESANQRVVMRTKEAYYDDNPLVSADLLDPDRASSPEEEEAADDSSKSRPHENGIIVNESEDVEAVDKVTPVTELDSDVNNGDDNGSPASGGSRSRSNSLSPNDPEDGGKRKRGGRPNLARYNVKRTKRISGEPPDDDKKEASSLKIVFSKV